MKKIRALSILNLAAFLLHFSFSYLTQLKLINQQNVGEISYKYPSLFTPAGITFSIWGFIYTGLFMFCIYHIVIAFKDDIKHEGNRDVEKTGRLFIINNLATALWLLAWTHEYILITIFLMLIQLITLLSIISALCIYDPSRSWYSKVFTQMPLSLYMGWICIAAIANAAAYLTAINWNRFGISAANWVIIMISIAVAAGVYLIFFRKNIIPALVMIWALYGITLKLNAAENTGLSPALLPTLWIAAGILAAAIMLRIIISSVKNQHLSQNKKSIILF